jgi:pimeloyl-ACP methyl ester carboxylesterase
MSTLAQPRTTAPRRLGVRPLSGTWRRLPLGALPPALAAAALVLLLPRGPLTAGQALVAMGFGLAAGGASGVLLRSRWAMLLAPLVVASAYELSWVWLDGPTVDGPRVDSAYGILALLLGRGFFGLVCFTPMVLGAALGAAAMRLELRASGPRRRRATIGLWARRAVTAATAVGLAALALVLTRDGSTPPFTGPDGEPVPGSIATLERVTLGGGEQWISIRGRDVEKPVLLYLHGGPIQSGLPFTRFLFEEIQRDFVVVDWDQRGAGKSHPALEPTSTFTLDRMVADTIQLSHYLAHRFDERKIYLAGTSWGSTLGVLAAQRRPDLYHAFIGGGQMVSQRETDLRIYRDLLAHARATGDGGLAAKLRSFGPPPYDDVYANAFVMQHYEALEPKYTFVDQVKRVEDEHFRELGPWGVLGREYDLVEKVNVLRGLLETFAVLYPQLQGIDFRRDVPRLEVPVYVVRGAAELAARDDLAVEWFQQLDAPRKQLISFGHAGHAVLTERPDGFRTLLLETVLPETYDRGDTR